MASSERSGFVLYHGLQPVSKSENWYFRKFGIVEDTAFSEERT